MFPFLCMYNLNKFFLFHFVLCLSDEYETIVNSRDDIAPVGYLRFTKVHLQEKDVSFNIM